MTSVLKEPFERSDGLLHFLSIGAPVSAAKYMALLTAYLDESGTHQDSTYCIVAGFVSSDREWRKFSREWRSALQREGLTGLHMKKFWPNNMAREWSRLQKAGSVSRLTKVIGKHLRQMVGVGVSQQDFDRLIADRRADRFYPSAYTYCVCAAVFEIEMWLLRKGYVGPFNVVIGSGQKRSGEALMLLNMILQSKSDHPWHTRISSASPESVMALQACDLVSYGLYKRETSDFPKDLLDPLMKLGKPIGEIHDLTKIGKTLDIWADSLVETFRILHNREVIK